MEKENRKGLIYEFPMGVAVLKGGLSGTVCTDKTVTVSLSKLNIDVLEQGFFADPKRNVICTDHSCYSPDLLILIVRMLLQTAIIP